MKIESIDKKSYIFIDHSGDEDYSSFQFGAHIDISHGSFSAKNNDIQFINLSKFISILDEFITNRDLEPELTGTYNTFLRFYNLKGKNTVMLQLSLGDMFSGYSETVNYSLNGCFELNQEDLLCFLNSIKSYEYHT